MARMSIAALRYQDWKADCAIIFGLWCRAHDHCVPYEVARFLKQCIGQQRIDSIPFDDLR